MKNFVVGQTITNLACIGSDYVNSIGVIEGVGKDWLVVRSSDGEAHFVYGGAYDCLTVKEEPKQSKREYIDTITECCEKPVEVFNSESDHHDWNKFLHSHGIN